LVSDLRVNNESYDFRVTKEVVAALGKGMRDRPTALR
jgi:hypothetical protein